MEKQTKVMPLDEGAIIDLADRILGRLGMDDQVLEFANKLFEAIANEQKE